MHTTIYVDKTKCALAIDLFAVYNLLEHCTHLFLLLYCLFVVGIKHKIQRVSKEKYEDNLPLWIRMMSTSFISGKIP